MQEKQGRMLTWMAGLLVALVGVVVLGERDADPVEEGDDTWSDALPGVTRSQITDLTITSGAESLVLQRGDDGWQITAPIQAPANAEQVRSLLGTLEDLECGDDLEAASAQDFGLAPPRWTVTLTAEQETHRVRIGAAAPVGERTYVQCTDDAVRTTTSRIADALSTAADDFRSRDIARFPLSALTALTVTLPLISAEPLEAEVSHATLTAQRTAAGWRDGQSGALLDEEKLLTMAEAMTSAQVERFDAEPPTPPLISLTALADGEEHTLHYGINGTAQVPLQDAPVTLSGDFPVPGTLDTLLSTSLLPIEPVALSALSVRLGEQTVSATRDSNGWTQPAAEALLAALLEVRVDRTLPSPPHEGPAYGEVVLTDAEGLAVSVALHQDIDGQRVVIDPAGGPPFLMPATELARLLEALGS